MRWAGESSVPGVVDRSLKCVISTQHLQPPPLPLGRPAYRVETLVRLVDLVQVAPARTDRPTDKIPMCYDRSAAVGVRFKHRKIC